MANRSAVRCKKNIGRGLLTLMMQENWGRILRVLVRYFHYRIPSTFKADADDGELAEIHSEACRAIGRQAPRSNNAMKRKRINKLDEFITQLEQIASERGCAQPQERVMEFLNEKQPTLFGKKPLEYAGEPGSSSWCKNASIVRRLFRSLLRGAEEE